MRIAVEALRIRASSRHDLVVLQRSAAKLPREREEMIVEVVGQPCAMNDIEGIELLSVELESGIRVQIVPVHANPRRESVSRPRLRYVNDDHRPIDDCKPDR